MTRGRCSLNVVSSSRASSRSVHKVSHPVFTKGGLQLFRSDRTFRPAAHP